MYGSSLRLHPHLADVENFKCAVSKLRDGKMSFGNFMDYVLYRLFLFQAKNARGYIQNDSAADRNKLVGSLSELDCNSKICTLSPDEANTVATSFHLALGDGDERLRAEFIGSVKKYAHRISVRIPDNNELVPFSEFCSNSNEQWKKKFGSSIADFSQSTVSDELSKTFSHRPAAPSMAKTHIREDGGRVNFNVPPGPSPDDSSSGKQIADDITQQIAKARSIDKDHVATKITSVAFDASSGTLEITLPQRGGTVTYLCETNGADLNLIAEVVAELQCPTTTTHIACSGAIDVKFFRTLAAKIIERHCEKHGHIHVLIIACKDNGKFKKITDAIAKLQNGSSIHVERDLTADE
jgi:hypothetical protein